ncbi:MAG: CRISPR system precrRNA processing endoribonuclease RAMP protein Cas6 [Candidatus Azobacteroides sp.]|nr:CRISPR system precrRNA processing endoribonuclease RAMP protein Cas6 [Candidatus Azobacteroides sp.]
MMKATADVAFDAWSGAIIRNNLLFAADKIRIQKTNRSLREEIDSFPLNEEHPLYKELKDGFPKSYVLTDFSHIQSPAFIRKDEIFSFSLLLVGNFNDYRFYFFEAIREMCERGFGKPITPFQLLDISENSLSPVTLSDFMSEKTDDCRSEITIRFLTPVILYRLKEKKNKQLSFQDKSNRFPSFYQLVRSTYLRLQKLSALYVEPAACSSLPFEEMQIESCLENAGRPLLQSANIQYVSLPNTQKKEMKNEMPLAGYVGEQKYVGHFQDYLPLLQFMEKLGVGNETVYGMGRYEVKEKCFMNRTNENQKIELENEIETLDSYIHCKITNSGEENQAKMLKLPQLIVRLKNDISQREIPLFIESIMKSAMKMNDLFRGHIADCNLYHYPFIQFKRISGQATIICIGEGTESIGILFSSANNHIDIEGKEIAIEIETVKAEKILIQAWEGSFIYTIRKYLPLSSENYIEYQNIKDEKDCHEFIEKILRANLLFFTKSLGIHLARDIECKIMELEEKSVVKYKNHSFVSFDLKFKTNVSLPNYIGLGIGVIDGFGMVARVRN